MAILWALIIGTVWGSLFQLFVEKPTQGDLVIRMLLGIAGSLVGGFIARSFDLEGCEDGSGHYLVACLLGAVALLTIFQLLIRRRQR